MNRVPRVSIGMPIYNGEVSLPKALDALLAQTYEDFEIVICDNASTDRTEDICKEYVKKDRRVRYYRNLTNIGQIANFNRVFELSRGKYFRWVGCNDWWSPDYIKRCVEALDAHPSAIMTTCYQEHLAHDGTRYYEEYIGERVDASEPHKRFGRMLWFLGASRYYLDPIYSMICRDALLRTHLLRPILHTDRVLAAELSLIGPFCHVPECLASRKVTADMSADDQVKQFGVPAKNTRMYYIRRTLAMASDVLSQPMSSAQKIYCLLFLARFHSREQLRLFYWWSRSRMARCLRLLLHMRPEKSATL